MNTDRIGELLIRGADEIEYGALDDELLGALALQTDEPFIATLALGEMARRIPSRGRDFAEAILQRAPWDDYLTARALEILFARDPDAACREMSRLVESTVHPTVLASMVENVLSDRERFEDGAGKELVAQIASGLVRAKVKSFENPEQVAEFLQRYALPGTVPSAFLLRGHDGTDPAAEAARRQFEQQTIDLARQMRDAIDRHDDPDVVAQREAHEREKAARIGARLASFYVKTGQRDGNEPLDQAIAKMLRYFAQRIDVELPEVGNASTIDQPLPTLDSDQVSRWEDDEIDAAVARNEAEDHHVSGGDVAAKRSHRGDRRACRVRELKGRHDSVRSSSGSDVRG